jgi:hypothetical protein
MTTVQHLTNKEGDGSHTHSRYRALLWKCLTILLLAGVPGLADSILSVSIDTSGISGTVGQLAVEFVSGGGPHSNIASITDFKTDGTLHSPTFTGTVTGTLPGTVKLQTDSVTSVFNEYLNGFTFGTTESFTLELTSNAPGDDSSPDELSLFLLAADGQTSLITTSDPTSANSLLVVDIDGSGGGASQVFSVLSPGGIRATVTPADSTVPEPSTFTVCALVLACSFLLWFRNRHWKAAGGSVIALMIISAAPLSADELVDQQTGADLALARYGLTGKNVLVAILDRGIQFQHPDFRNPNGTTRIKWMLDMSGQNDCDASNPAPIEYTEGQINSALTGSTSIPERDAVGHGTLTAGIAAGNGRAAANGKYKGIAPNADLLIVKMTSDGVPPYSINGVNYPGEQSFTACHTQALAWVAQKARQLGEPMVALINSGTQLWGPTDGTSVVSRAIDALFQNVPGRLYVEASGDEGGLPTHAAGTYAPGVRTTIDFTKAGASDEQLGLWYSGDQPANVSIVLAKGTVVGPVGPNASGSSRDGKIQIVQYQLGQESYPVTSSSGDHFVWIDILNHSGAGQIWIDSVGSTKGKFDIYGDFDAKLQFSDHLVSGRITDYASTRSAINTGAYVSRNSWIDIDNDPQSIPSDIPEALWANSSGGPTRDGRLALDLTTPGENLFAAIGTTSYWSTFRGNLVQDGAGFYSRQGATSGASPITVGAVALMLQMKPDLDSEQVRTILHETATSDSFTGTVPNADWGYGKINIKAALDRVCADYPATDVTSQVRVTRSGIRRNPLTGHFAQMLAVTNAGSAIRGPISLSVDGLRPGVKLSNQAGNTACLTPLSPYLVLENGASLSSGETVNVVVEFENPANQNLAFTTRLVSGLVR